MEQPTIATDKRRRRSPSPASSPSPGPSRPSAQLTVYPDRHLNKRQRRDGGSSDTTAGPLSGPLVRDDSTRDHARVLSGNAYDQRNINQHEGNHFEGGQAQDSARVHNGNHYGPVNNYNCLPNGGLVPDANQNPSPKPNGNNSENDIALVMESLSFVRMDNRQANIRKAYASTCKWIFEKPEYRDWRNPDLLAEHNGFFWIKSKPGAGKSTLMKFFVQSAGKKLPDDHVISFFFNARGELLEKSLEGLYRGLLHQLLTAVPRLQEVLKSQEVASLVNQAWPLDSLKTLLGDAISELGQDRVTCFIDALDECPEHEIRDMIDFFEELGESTAAEDIDLRVCFSSRHYPQITMLKCQPMVLDGQDGHEDDIARYVKSKLKVRKGKTAEEVRIAVQTKAKGIFMWVVLVVRILNEGSDRGSTNAELRKCLDRIPAELHDLFQDILQRGIQHNKYLVPILQWVSFAQRPLTREELYFAVRSGSTDFVASEPWDPEEDDAEAMDLFILDSSKGLAEMTKGKTPTIQFIHESVRDYLRDTGFAALVPELSGNLLGLTHEYLKGCCLNCITEPVLERVWPLEERPKGLPKAKSEEAKDLRKKASAMFPFLNYATDNIVFHAEFACANGVEQAEFITAMSTSVWRDLASLFAVHNTRRYPPEVSIARNFIYVGAEHLLSSAFLANAPNFGPDGLTTALQAVVASRNVHMVNVLLNITKKDACARLGAVEEKNLLFQAVRLRDTTIFTALFEGGIPIPADRYLEELLSEASKARNVQAIRYLSARGADFSSCSLGALHIAITRGLDDVVQEFIDCGVTLESCESRGMDPLMTACKFNRAGMARMLLGSSTNTSYTTTPERMGNLLSSACDSAYDDVVRVLLDFGAPVDHLDSTVGTALFRAVRNGRLDVVQLLLEKGADVNLGDGSQTPIAAACSHGELSIVKALVESGADVNLGDGSQTPIAAACTHGELSIVKALVESGADPDPPGEITPLSLALFSIAKSFIGPRGPNVSTSILLHPAKPDEAFARLLLSRSVNPNVRCSVPLRLKGYVIAHTEQSRAMLSRTLMYGAAIMDNAELLRLLFEKGADANAENGRDYHDALDDSCHNGHEEVVKVLLANGSSVPYRHAAYYRKMIGEAVEQRRSRIVELLLTEGHGFRAQNKSWYSGMLQLALNNGYDEIAKILTDNGVEFPGHA